MQNSRLYKLLKRLSGKDRRELSRFVRSPFFNSQEVLIQFYDLLEEFIFVLEVPPGKEQLFNRLFPGLPFKDVRIRLLMSDLLKLIEQYFIYQETQTDPLRVQLDLAKAYQKRNLPDQFDRSVQQIIAKIPRYPYRNAEFYQAYYHLHFEHFQYAATHKPAGELNLKAMSEELDIAYLANKLRQSCLQLSQQTIYRTATEAQFPIELEQFIESKEYLDIPLIGIYYHCYSCLMAPKNEAHFQKFRTLLLQNSHQFPAQEMHDLYKYAINYCIRKINSGKENYFLEVSELYKTGLEKGFLFENNRLSRFTYHNIVASGLRTGAFEWVEGFINQYKKNLEKQYQNSSYSFNLARLEYSRKHFPKALDLLQSSNYKDILLNLAAKTLLLKIYYETSEFQLLESHLEAMKIFLRRKKVQKGIGYHQTNYLNIIQYTKKLLAINPFQKAERGKLQQQIEEEEILTEKEWLVNQLAQI